MKIKNTKENLFTSTRLKLDFIAAIFVFFVLFSFSFVVYRLLTQDIIYQISPVFSYLEDSFYMDSSQFFLDLKRQTLFLLVVCDVLIFLISIFFFDRLVKKMLEPIEYVTNLQKRFASNVSHELRTPLSIMNMRGEILMSKIEKEEEKIDVSRDRKFISETKDGIEIILQEIKGLTNIIDDLLFEARIKYAEKKIEDISLETILKIINKVFKNQEYLKKEEVNYFIEDNIKNYSGSQRFIKVNPLHLERIFNNLISNSFKFTNKGEVKVVLEAYKNLGKEYLRISVRDTGIGVNKKEISKISERFYRGKNIEDEVSGTGIGLSIVKGIARDNKWIFSIKSEEGKGTIMDIRHIVLH